MALPELDESPTSNRAPTHETAVVAHFHTLEVLAQWQSLRSAIHDLAAQTARVRSVVLLGDR